MNQTKKLNYQSNKSKKQKNSKQKSSKQKSKQPEINLVLKPLSLSLEDVKKTSYQGTGEDLFFSFEYLYSKYKNFYVPIGDCKGQYIMWDVVTSWKCESKYNKNFRLQLPMEEDKFIKAIQYIILYRPDIEYILLPIYLGATSCKVDQGHFNIAIIDIFNMTYERFEPYGNYSEYEAHKRFNNKLLKIFSKAGINLELIDLEHLLPRIAFQDIEETEINKSLASARNTDPGGFCGAWSIWYAELFLTNKYKSKYSLLPRKELIKLAIKQIKIENSFRNFIRNYSAHLVKYRKKTLRDISKNCANSISSMDFEQCSRLYIRQKIKKIFDK